MCGGHVSLAVPCRAGNLWNVALDCCSGSTITSKTDVPFAPGFCGLQTQARGCE